jgi:hypothetical protein
MYYLFGMLIKNTYICTVVKKNGNCQNIITIFHRVKPSYGEID